MLSSNLSTFTQLGIWIQFRLRNRNNTESNSPTPIKGMTLVTLSIMVNFCLHSHMQYSTSFFIVFLHLVCVCVRCHLTKPKWHEPSRCSKIDLANVMWQQPMESVRVWCLEYGPENKPPGICKTSCYDVPQLARTATSGKWHFATARRLPDTADGLRPGHNNQNVRKRLHEDNLYRKPRDTILLPQHSRNWLEFGVDHQNWPLCRWRPVLFTNKSAFHVSTCDRHVRVWRRSGDCRLQCPWIWAIRRWVRDGVGLAFVWVGVRTCMSLTGVLWQL